MKKERSGQKADAALYGLVVLAMLSAIAAVVMGILNAVQVPGKRLVDVAKG